MTEHLRISSAAPRTPRSRSFSPHRAWSIQRCSAWPRSSQWTFQTGSPAPPDGARAPSK